ncbi:MAG: hypothetical protein MUF49_26460 [Oculatellaceae cyanobacterium Prado106]|nr:hypothetical protein [Oculatellaceae cyanobacterium Prado106]
MNQPGSKATQSSDSSSKVKAELSRFVKKRELSRQTGLSGETLKKYRDLGFLRENIHWIRINSKLVLYNLPLILDWLQNIHDPDSHWRAVEAYLTELPSNQIKQRR